MTGASILPLVNGRAVSTAAVPHLELEEFRRLIINAEERGSRVSALFGVPAGGQVELFVVLASDEQGVLEVSACRLTGDTFPSMTPSCPEVHLFERELAEEWGLKPEGHPWLKPVRHVQPKRAGVDPFGLVATPSQPGVTSFYRVEGDEVHEVAVGPVHAGVIEPGHFRFQCHGERVMHLEIALGYQHRGVERALLGSPNSRGLHYAETLCGDTSVGHATAYCQVLEGLAGARVPARAMALRGVGLELERLANHTGDLGALAGDVGFLPTASYCGRLRGDFLNLTAEVCGNRFGRGLVRPGGVGFDVEPERAKRMTERLAAIVRDVSSAVELMWDNASVQARFEDTGMVSTEVARSLGMVGPAARASGVSVDVRRDHPSGIYRFAQVPVPVLESGDVAARGYVRHMEIDRSATFVREQLARLPAGVTRAAVGPLGPSKLCAALVEGWRGELCHVAITDEAGRLKAYKVVDASFHNWPGLAMALREQQISDFPLCNKSFNLSYCGHDL